MIDTVYEEYSLEKSRDDYDPNAHIYDWLEIQEVLESDPYVKFEWGEDEQ